MLRLICLLFASLFCVHAALAAENAPVASLRDNVTLVSDTDAVAQGTPYRLGLRFQMAPGWHTYGRNPGDAGLPVELNWTLPGGTEVGDIVWPTPKRQAEGPLMTFAYTGTIMLVVPATGPGPLRLHASWLICNNICVPEEGDFSLDLPAGMPSPSAQAPLFTAAEAAQPRPSPYEAHIAPDGTLRVTGAGLNAQSVRDAWFIPTLPDLVVPTGQQTLSHTANSITLNLPKGTAFTPGQPLPGVLVLRDGGGQETSLAVNATPVGAAARLPPVTTSLWQALGAALLGGLILNLMPCVFPVLAMKAMAIARLSTRERHEARTQATSYTLGVIASFAVIGFTVLALRQLGHAVGWGFQFQSPVFVVVMAWVLFAVGLNLSGVYAIETRMAGAGQSLTMRHGHASSFFSGVLAVLVATPCTVPFMGVALAAAFAAPPAETLAVFGAMGLGLAAPTAVLAILPGLGHLLPRPGRWMEILRQALAFPMYGACAWLVWVASIQAGDAGVLAVASGLVLVGFAAWVWRFGRLWGRGLAVAAAVGAIALLPGLSGVQAPAAETTAGSEPFSSARLAALRAEGKPVFLNMTAAWCVTCLVNERVALSPEPVRQALTRADVTMMKGDWTRPNPDIADFLRAQGRDGVPLYLFYPPGDKPPVVLPQLLTQASVLDALKPYAVVGRP